MKKYVLDTSVLLCYLRNEKNSNYIYNILNNQTSLIFMHRANLGELYYNILKYDGESKANQVYTYVIQYPLTFIDDLNDPFLIKIGQLKVTYGLAYLDAIAATTAMFNSAILLTKDNDFRVLHNKKIIDIEFI